MYSTLIIFYLQYHNNFTSTTFNAHQQNAPTVIDANHIIILKKH